MKSYPTDRIRNVAFVGHSDAGKTTLAEALLVRAGTVPRAGKVDDGSSVLDTEPESTKRHMSLSLTLAPFEWKADDGNTYKVNLLDTPGYLDFEGEVDAALSVADLAVFVVSAVEGVEVQTERLWRKVAALGLPRMVFVNKEDKERADFHSVLDQLRAAFGAGITPLELPLGEAAALHGVADVLSEAALEYGRRPAPHRTMPAEVAAEEHALHDALLEEIVAGDGTLERYLAGEVPTLAELERTLAHEVLDCTEFPGAARLGRHGRGHRPPGRLHLRAGPIACRSADAGRRGRRSRTGAGSGRWLSRSCTCSRPSPTRTSASSRCSRCCRAWCAPTTSCSTAAHGGEERLHALLMLRGKEQLPVTDATAGDIAAVAKLGNTHTGDTLAPKGSPVKVVAPSRTAPQYGVAIVPRTQSDDDKMGNALGRLQAEDPSL